MLSQVALTTGWDACTPVSTETGADLENTTHRDIIKTHIVQEDPDLTILAPPCDAWSQIQKLKIHPFKQF